MGKVLIKAGTLIDCTGKNPERNKSIIVEGGIITKITEGTENLCEYKNYDLSEYTVLPGMINCHVHIDMEPVGNSNSYFESTDITEKVLNCEKNMHKYLESGVTYIRSLGSQNYMDIKFRDMKKKGLVVGPDILAAGFCITMTGGHGYIIGIESDGEAQCRKATRTVIKNGADVVKIMATGGIMTQGVEPGSSQLTFEEMKASIDEAHKAGKKTAAHAQGAEGIKNAILAGVDSIEHGMILTDECIELMIDKGTYLIPTLVAPYFINKYGVQAGIPEYAVKKSVSMAEKHLESFRKAHKASVKIAMGTDGGTPFNGHDMSWLELKLMTDNGMSNMEALMSATKTAAELLGIEKHYGTLEVGKTADIIAVKGNPLEDIAAMGDIIAVFKNGTWTGIGRLCDNSSNA